MSIQTVTVTDTMGNHPVTVPIRPYIEREGACLDLILVTALHIGCPINVRLSLRTDGSVHVWQTRFEGSDNTYAHIDEETNPRMADPTEAQRRTIARWWAGEEKPLGLRGGVGKTALEWAFKGLSMEQVTQKYIDGPAPLLA